MSDENHDADGTATGGSTTDSTAPAGSTPAAEAAPAKTAPSRRALIGWGGAGLALGAAVTGGTAVAVNGEAQDGPAGPAPVPFHGAHQAGIGTAVQDRLHFAAFDVTTKDPELLVAVLKEWTRAAERMTAGKPVGDGAAGGLAEAPPDDTGEALGLDPARLTLTFGVGPSLFDGREGFEKLKD